MHAQICVTGSMGAGKTSVSEKIIKLCDAISFNADDFCRELMEKGAVGYDLFNSATNSSFLDRQGNLDRTQLKEAIIRDRDIKVCLENILHPLVLKKLQKTIIQNRKTCKYGVFEIPLYFEAGWHIDFDIVLSVYTDIETAVSRIIKRDGLTHKLARKFIDLQMSSFDKAMSADIVIDNSGTRTETMYEIFRAVSYISRATAKN